MIVFSGVCYLIYNDIGIVILLMVEISLMVDLALSTADSFTIFQDIGASLDNLLIDLFGVPSSYKITLSYFDQILTILGLLMNLIYKGIICTIYLLSFIISVFI